MPYYITINSFTQNTGHVNVTLTDATGNSSTYGNNYDGWGNPLNGPRPEDGHLSRPDIHSSTIEVTQEQFQAALDRAQQRVANNTGLPGDEDYTFIGNNCVDFADDVLKAAGFPQGTVAGHVPAGTMADIYADLQTGIQAEHQAQMELIDQERERFEGSFDPDSPHNPFNPNNPNSPFNPQNPNSPFNVNSGGGGGGGGGEGGGGDGGGGGEGGGGEGGGGSGGGGGGGGGGWGPFNPFSIGPFPFTFPPWGPPTNPITPPMRDPLVIDLDGDGVELMSAAQSSVHLDMDQNGFAEKVAWVKPDDGLLIRDANGDGQFSGVSELFGDANQDGFAVLGAFDVNADGRIDSADAIFDELRIWRDLDGDGTSDAGELSTLTASGVSSVSLDAVASNEIVEGSRLGFTSTAQTAAGMRTVASAYFESDPLLSRWVQPDGFQFSADSMKLPQLVGYGAVKDLAAAMALDPALASTVRQLVIDADSLSGAGLRAAFSEILEAWAGVTDVGRASRGVHVDGRHLAVIEKLYDGDFQLRFPSGRTESNPDAAAGANIEQIFYDAVSSMLATFMAQIAVCNAFQTGEFVSSSEFFGTMFLLRDEAGQSSDFDLAVKYAFALASKDPDAGFEILDRQLAFLPGAILNEFGGDAAALRARMETLAVGLPSSLAQFANDLARIAGERQGLNLVGGAAGDTLEGAALSDILRGGAGDDLLSGKASADSYHYGPGDGHDRILEGSSRADTFDKLVLGAGLTSDKLLLTRAGNDLQLAFQGAAGSVLIDDADESGGYGVERIVFGDGVVWTRDQLLDAYLAQKAAAGPGAWSGFSSRGDSMSGSSGADTLSGESGADTLAGAAGDDRLVGGRGNDRFQWARGDGADTAVEGYWDLADTLALIGVTPAQVAITREGDDLLLAIAESSPGAGDGGSVRLKDSVNESSGLGVEQVVFADGTVWTRAVMVALTTSDGTSGADTIIGTNVDEVFDAGAGDDRIEAGSGADELTGGAGNDVLIGGRGNDIFHWAHGDGSDVITEGYWDTNDRLVLAGVAPADVTLVRAGGDVTLVIAGSAAGAGGSVRLRDNLNEDSSHGVDNIMFDDGTLWTRDDLRLQILTQSATTGADTIEGFNTADTISGGAGDDRLIGGRGSDVFNWARGDGADVVSDGYWDTNDRLVLAGVAPADVTLLRAGGDVTLVIAGSAAGAGGSVRLRDNLNEDSSHGVDKIMFDDGTIWTRDDLRLQILAQSATTGADTIEGFNTADTISGGAGDDRLIGGRGSDVFTWARGDGDDAVSDGYWDTNDRLVVAGVAPAEVALVRAGDDVILMISASAAGAGGSVRLKDHLNDDSYFGVEQVIFDDGTVWTGDDLRSMANVDTSTAGGDTIEGSDAADTLSGGGGDDYLIGGRGNDIVYGEDGADRVVGGDGDDELIGEAGADSLYGGDGYDTAVFLGSSEDLAFLRESDGAIISTALFGTDGVDRLQDVEAVYFLADSTWKSIEQVAGAYGSASSDPWVGGSEYDDRLFGLDGDDVLSGAGGDDTLYGGNGAEDVANYDGVRANFTLGRNAYGGVTVTDASGLEGTDLLIGVEAIYFDGSAEWRWIADLVGDYGTSGDDAWLAGTAADDKLYGLGGGDVLRGYGGDDLIDGGDGDDEASYAGSRADFSFQLNPDGSVTVTDATGAEGIDQLINVEALYFEADNAGYLLAGLLPGGSSSGAAFV